jgi:D-alanine-D-alanine ligase
MKRLRVLCLVHETLVPPDSLSVDEDFHDKPWRTERYVSDSLHRLGHTVKMCGVQYDLSVIRSAIDEFRPDIIFNLLEEFHGQPLYDQNVVSYLELIPLPYTGCNPRGMMLARDKALTRKVLSYHRIPGPDFVVFPQRAKIKRPKKLTFPLLVKSQVEEASLGISQKSVVTSDEEFEQRVAWMHERYKTDVIVEEYIEGRELYVGMLGDQRLQVFPIWELVLDNMPDSAPHIATRRVKWDLKYQEKYGIISQKAEGLTPELEKRIIFLSKRTYKALGLTGYGRIDLRVTSDGGVYVIEANPNPELAYGEDFADASACYGWDYDNLISRILIQGLNRSAP